MQRYYLSGKIQGIADINTPEAICTSPRTDMMLDITQMREQELQLDNACCITDLDSPLLNLRA